MRPALSLRTIRIEIPVLPDRRLGQNGRLHWAEAKKLKDELKEQTYMACMVALRDWQGENCTRWKPLDRAVLSAEVHIPKGNRAKAMDDDNFWATQKSARDVLQVAKVPSTPQEAAKFKPQPRAGVIVSDGPRFLSNGAVRWIRGQPRALTVLIITSLVD